MTEKHDPRHRLEKLTPARRAELRRRRTRSGTAWTPGQALENHLDQRRRAVDRLLDEPRR